MDEHLGDLWFAFRAGMREWRNDLQEADRIQNEYRRKWEQPVNMRAGVAAGVGVGGSGGGIGGSPNIVGTSNGDVTWHMENAMAAQRSREVSALSVARRMMNASSSGGSGVAGKRAQFESLGMDYDDMLEQKRESDRQMRENQRRHSQLMRSMNQELSNADSGDLRSIINPETGEFMRSGGQERKKWYEKTIPLQTMLRATMAGLVVDTLAGELNSEENYRKAVRLSGLDQGAASDSTLQAFKGAIGGIPLVGGMLSNLVSPLTAPIETQNELTRMQVQYQGQSAAARMGAYGTTMQAAQINAGPLGLVRSAIGISQQREAARAIASSTTDTLRQNAGFESESDDANSSSFMSGLERGGRMGLKFLTGGYVRSSDEVDRDIEAARKRNNRRRAEINSVNSGLNKADDALRASQERALDYQGQYQVAMSEANIMRLRDENAWHPGGAAAMFAVRQAVAMSGYLTRPPPEGYDPSAPREKLNAAGKAFRDENQLVLGNIYQTQEGVRSSIRDLQQNYLFGSGQSFNPFTQSSMSFVDRSPETYGDKLEANTQALVLLNQLLQRMADSR